jgi:hypothetical protein
MSALRYLDRLKIKIFVLRLLIWQICQRNGSFVIESLQPLAVSGGRRRVVACPGPERVRVRVFPIQLGPQHLRRPGIVFEDHDALELREARHGAEETRL